MENFDVTITPAMKYSKAVIPASEARRESLTPSVPLKLRGMKGGYSGQAGMTEEQNL